MKMKQPRVLLRGIQTGLGLGLLALAATAFGGAPKVDDWVTEFTGSPIYPSQLGQPGWPGMLAGQSATEPWGFPERLPYPGAVEHVRITYQRYVPVVPICNAKTLVKNFLGTELPGVTGDRITDYAEPIYSVMKYEIGKPTGHFNQPVKVVKWDKTHPPIELPLGKLGIGTYTVRVIAATPTAYVERAPQRLVIDFDVNDGLTNEVNHYRKRCAAIDEFYSIVEFFFHAPEAREYTVKLWVDDSTVLPVVYLHNIDLHNKLAQLAGQAGKKGPSLYDADERLASWKEKGTLKPDERTPEQRFADDAKIWNSAMPVNAQPLGENGNLAGEAVGIAASMIPDTVKDDGMGIDFYGTNIFWNRSKEYIAAFNKDHKKDWLVDGSMKFAQANPGLTRQTAYPVAHKLSQTAYPRPFAALLLAWEYQNTGNEIKARQAAINLARLGLQNITHGSRQAILEYDLIPQVVNGDTAFRHRMKEMDYGMRGYYDDGIPDANGDYTGNFIASYDYLFPYIQTNQDLANSLGRFIPGIKTPADVVRFYDTYVLQYYAQQVMTYNVWRSDSAPGMMANVIAVQQDPAICKPWIDWLFHYLWAYPLKPMGADEAAVNNLSRDGTTFIGSTFYTGSFLVPMLKTLRAYKQAGGVLPVDMTDPELFPKATFGERFQSDIMVAGGYTFWIGDVSGPDAMRLKNKPKMRKNPDLIPNNPSRVLSAWGGILETGREFDDFHQRRAVGVRVGTGYGHAHNDPLDLQIWAQGVPMSGDGGGRPGYGYPDTAWIGNHNTVMAKASVGPSWISSFAPLTGAQYLLARTLNKDLYARQVVLVDIDATNSYVVDVFRVTGDDAPAYSFHGMPADQFEVNVPDKQKGIFAEAARFPLTPDTQWTGTAPAHLVATWRMRRDPEKIPLLLPQLDHGAFVKAEPGEFNFPGAERNALGPDFDEKSPRKFVRLHLLGHSGDQACGARAVSLQGFTYSNENFYLKPKHPNGKTLFPVVFEPYTGTPFIQSVRLLTKEEAVGDALEPVAIEVTLVSGRRDIIYLAPREAGATVIQGVGTFHGEYALVSYDAAGIRQAVLAGGTKIEVQGISVTTETPAYTGTIRSIDYRKRTAEFSNPLPPAATNSVIETGPAGRPTSYALTQVEGTQVKFLQGMDFAMSRVDQIATDGLQQPGAVSQAPSWRVDPKAPVEQPVLRSPINVIPGMTVTDDRCETFWKWAPEANKTNLVLAGTAAPQKVLKEGDGLWVWEIGPGDPYRLPVQVNVIRQADGRYTTTANAPVKVQTGNQ